MNNVLLECKQSAISLTTSDNPPRTENGKKKGNVHESIERLVGRNRIQTLRANEPEFEISQQESRKH